MTIDKDSERDLYEILGVSKNATDEEIRKAYLRKSVELHPDKHPPALKDAKAQAFIEMKNAYDILRLPAARRNYDSQQGFSYNFRPRSETGRAYPSQREPPQSADQAFRGEHGSQNGFRSSSNTYAKHCGEPSFHAAGSAKQSKKSKTDCGAQGCRYDGQKADRPPTDEKFDQPHSSKSYSEDKRSHQSKKTSAEPSSKSGNPQRPTSSGPSSERKHEPRDDSREPRYGVTKSKENCKRCIQVGGFCKQHKYQEQDPDSREPRYGVTKSKENCKRCIQVGGFCKQHKYQEQDPAFGKMQGTSKNTHRHGDRPCYGKTMSGETCKLCFSQGGFCHLHGNQNPALRQSYKEGNKTNLPNKNAGEAIPSKIYGVTRKGQPCLNCIMQSNFCRQHAWQSKVTA